MFPQGGFTVSCTLKSWSWETGLKHLMRWVTEQNRRKPLCCLLLMTPHSCWVLVFIIVVLHNVLLHDISSFWCLFRCQQSAEITWSQQLRTDNQNVCFKTQVVCGGVHIKQWFFFARFLYSGWQRNSQRDKWRERAFQWWLYTFSIGWGVWTHFGLWSLFTHRVT